MPGLKGEKGDDDYGLRGFPGPKGFRGIQGLPGGRGVKGILFFQRHRPLFYFKIILLLLI